MNIYLIRHTTPDIEKGICYGQTNLNLAVTAQDEFNEINKLLKAIIPKCIYTSPLKRCQELANFLNKNNLPIIHHNSLMELNFGNWEMKPWVDINETEFNAWEQNFVDNKVPNGESYIDLSKRAIDFINEFITSDEPTFIVTHSGVIRALLAHFLEFPLNRSFDIMLDYGSIIHIKRSKEGFQQVNFLKT